MIGRSGSSAASRGRLASHAVSSASLRYASPRYSPFASPVMSSPLTALSLLLSSFPRMRESRAAGSTPPESESQAAGRMTRAALGELLEPVSRRLFPLFHLVEIRRQQLLNRKHAPADGCRCLRKYTANMTIVCLSISQVVEIGVDAARGPRGRAYFDSRS